MNKKIRIKHRAKNTSKLPKTVVFVDYESWFYGLYKDYGCTPNTTRLIEDLKEIGKLDQIFFFGDFTKEEIGSEKSKLWAVSNNIVDCVNQRSTKIEMLDFIYQHVIKRNDVEQYILVTGDSHFIGVCAFLRNFCNKIVGIYSVQNTASVDLINVANWNKLIIPEEVMQYDKLKSVLHDLKNNGNIYFTHVTKRCSKKHGLTKASVVYMLNKMIESGVITQNNQDETNRFLIINWNKLNDFRV